MSEMMTCECGEAFNPNAAPGSEVNCPRCMKSMRVPEMTGMLGYMGPRTGTAVMSRRAIDLLGQTSLWVRIMSLMMFVGSGFMVLGGVFIAVGGLSGPRGGGPESVVGCVYIPFALLYIVPAIFLWRYAGHSKAFSISRDSMNLENAIQAQKSFWKFTAVTAIVVMAIYAVIIVLAIAAAVLRP